MSAWMPDTTKEITASLIAVLTAGGWLWNRRSGGGGLTTVWAGIISFLAAPVERSLAQREAKALRVDNTRLQEDNSQKDQEIARLRSRLLTGSNGGFSSSGDGPTRTSPSASTSTDDSTAKA